MLLAVEGGRFFSSSASGYSNGLNLLLLGHKKEEKPMRVTPWNQYHLVAQEPDPDPDPDLQLANKRCVCGCASFSCFGRPAAGVESPANEPTHQQNVLKTSSDLEKVEETLPSSDFVDGDGDGDGNSTNVTFCLKSSLKIRVAIGGVNNNNNNNDVNEVENGAGQIDRRNVQWTDVIGGELVEIREFEPSEHSDSDDEFEHSSGKTCSCMIM